MAVSGYTTPEKKAQREAGLEKMRERFRRRHVPQSKAKQKIKREKRPPELTFVDLADACSIARRRAGGSRYGEALAECEGYFRELAGDEFAPEELTATWRQTAENTFAVRSDELQMTEAGLRMAMYQIPKDLRRNLLTFRWRRRFKDSDGEQWLEFEGA